MSMQITAVCISFESEDYENKVIEIIQLRSRSPTIKELTKLLRNKYPIDTYGLIKVEASKTTPQKVSETVTLKSPPPGCIWTAEWLKEEEEKLKKQLEEEAC